MINIQKPFFSINIDFVKWICLGLLFFVVIKFGVTAAIQGNIAQTCGLGSLVLIISLFLYVSADNEIRVLYIELLILLLPFWSLHITGQWGYLNRFYAMAGLGICIMHSETRARLWNRQTALLSLLALLMFISIFIATDWVKGRRILISFTVNTFICYAVCSAYINSKEDVYRIFKVWYIFAVFNAILTFFQIAFGEDFFFQQYWKQSADAFYQYQMESGAYSGWGLFRHRGYNALFLSVGVCIGYVMTITSRWRTLYTLPTLALLCGAITFTGSRTGVYLLIFSFLFPIFVFYLGSPSKKLGAKGSLLFCALMGALFWLFFHFDTLIDLVGGISVIDRFQALDNDMRYGRLYLWKYMLREMGSPLSPLGIGLGETTQYRNILDVHSAHLQILIEVGSLGFLVWCLFIWTGISKAFKMIRILLAYLDRFSLALCVITTTYLLSIVQYLIIGMSVLSGNPIIVLPFAIIAALYRIEASSFSKEIKSKTN